MTAPTPFLELLLRRVAGDLTAAEADVVQAWADASDENARTLAALQATLAPDGDGAEPPDEEVLWRRISAGLRNGRSGIALHRDGFAPMESARGWRHIVTQLGIAAALAAAVSGGLWYVAREHRPPAPSSAGTSVKEHEYATRRGERALFRLPDGTKAMLGVESRLRVRDDFGRHSRDLDLTGEAYFDVAHDTTQPFRVHTAQGIAHDLGTRFVVRAYPGDSVTDVVVAEGRVALRGDQAAASTALLARGDRGQVTASGRVRAEHGVSVDDYLAWTEGRLVFRDTPLRDAATRLSRWFDVDVRVAPGGNSALPLTASFDDEPAPEVLRLVAVSLGLRLTRHGREFTLSPR
jgi:transmembrane sensor